MKVPVVPIELHRPNKVSKKRVLENKHYKEIIYNTITSAGYPLSDFGIINRSDGLEKLSDRRIVYLLLSVLRDNDDIEVEREDSELFYCFARLPHFSNY